jgi:hypothetical protein
LFQTLIPQLHFGDFFNGIDPKRTSTRSTNVPSIQNDSARPQRLAGHSAAG